MKIPKVRGCCCFDLRYGSLIIACVQLAYAVVGLLDGIQLAATSSSDDGPGAVATVTAVKEDGTDYTFILGDKGALRKFVRMYLWLHLAETFGLMVIASLLVHGIRTKRRSLFIPWLGIHFLATVVFGALVFIVPVGAIVEFGTDAAGVGSAAGLACLLAFTVNAYVSVVVYSLYREIGAEIRARRVAPVDVEVYLPADQLPPAYEEIMKAKPMPLPATAAATSA